MKVTCCSLFLILALSFTIFSGNISAEEIKINKRNPGKNFKMAELKHTLLKKEFRKNPGSVLNIQNTEMSKTSGMLLGGGIGLIAGGAIGGVLASNSNDDNPIDEGIGIGAGILVGGLSGLLVGGLTGYLLGK